MMRIGDVKQLYNIILTQIVALQARICSTYKCYLSITFLQVNVHLSRLNKNILTKLDGAVLISSPSVYLKSEICSIQWIQYNEQIQFYLVMTLSTNNLKQMLIT